MKPKILCVGLCAVLVAGCNSTTEITNKPVDVAFKSNAAAQGIVGYEPTPVRAYLKSDGKKAELTGVPCQIEGSGYSAKLLTPSLVNLPDYRDKSRPVSVSCTYDGKQATAQSLPYNATSENMMNNSSGGGLLGAIIVAGIDAARNKSNDDWSYHSASVEFE